jgi:hypothetical protein
VFMNEVQVGPLVPGRGIRQRDPLSLYLLILCAKYLPALIHEVERSNAIRGTIMFTNAPTVSHLLFVDDCFISFSVLRKVGL